MARIRRAGQITPCHFGRTITNGVFSRYVEPDTDTLRIGFIAGMNCVLRAIADQYTNEHEYTILHAFKSQADKLAAVTDEV